MTRIRKRFALALAGAGAASALIFAPALAASAAPAVTSASVPVTNNTAGESGYYANEDNATRFRYTQTTVTAQASLKNLNGLMPGSPGAVGTELCDPNTGYAMQVGLWWNGTKYVVSYGTGKFATNTFLDQCIQSEFVQNPLPSAPTLLTNLSINAGDQIALALYFDPRSHFGVHNVSISACDLTQSICRQYAGTFYTGSATMWEFGTGAVTNQPMLTAPAAIPLETFTNSRVTSYLDKPYATVPVGAVRPLAEANFVNGSGQTVMSPNGSLSPVIAGSGAAGSSFELFEGSTSP